MIDLVVRLFGALCSHPAPDPQNVSASTLALHRPCSLLWPSFRDPSFFLPTFSLTHLPPPLPFPTPQSPPSPGLQVGIPQSLGAVSHTGRSHSRQIKRVRLSHRPCYPTRRVRQGRKARQQRTGPTVTAALPSAMEAWPPAQGQTAMASEAPPRPERGRQSSLAAALARRVELGCGPGEASEAWTSSES